MAPDYLYFLQLSHSSRYGHSFPGIFTFSLPAGLAVLFLYHYLFKKPLFSLAPDHLARRVAADDLRYSFWPASRFALITASVLIGVFTHVIWDDFTHERGLFVTVVPDLKLYFGLHMPMYAFLQLASTAVGALLLAWAYWRWCRRTQPRSGPLVPQLALWSRLLIVAAGVGGIAGFAIPYGLQMAKPFQAEWFSVFVVKTIIAGITAGFVELCVFSVAWHLRKHRAPEADSGADVSVAD